MWHNNVGTSFCRFVTFHAFDRRTDRRTFRWWLNRALHCMQSHSKNWHWYFNVEFWQMDALRFCSQRHLNSAVTVFMGYPITLHHVTLGRTSSWRLLLMVADDNSISVLKLRHPRRYYIARTMKTTSDHPSRFHFIARLSIHQNSFSLQSRCLAAIVRCQSRLPAFVAERRSGAPVVCVMCAVWCTGSRVQPSPCPIGRASGEWRQRRNSAGGRDRRRVMSIDYATDRQTVAGRRATLKRDWG